MNTARLSISIVAYHNYKDIEVAIETLEKYTSKEIDKKVYIIDNGTKDINENEIRKFKGYINKYKDIEYIDANENLGFGKGHNLILDKINSRYHAIVNPDIIFKEDSLSKIIDYMENDQSIGMVIPKIVDEKGELQKVYREEVTIYDMFIRMFCPKLFPKRMERITLQYKDYNKEFQVPFGQGSFLVIKTELLKKLNGFDDRYFMYMEDADLCKRVNQISKLMYFPNTAVIHKWEKGSHKNKKLFKYHVSSMIKYFKKWRIKSNK